MRSTKIKPKYVKRRMRESIMKRASETRNERREGFALKGKREPWHIVFTSRFTRENTGNAIDGGLFELNMKSITHTTIVYCLFLCLDAASRKWFAEPFCKPRIPFEIIFQQLSARWWSIVRSAQLLRPLTGANEEQIRELQLAKMTA